MKCWPFPGFFHRNIRQNMHFFIQLAFIIGRRVIGQTVNKPVRFAVKSCLLLTGKSLRSADLLIKRSLITAFLTGYAQVS